MRAVKEVQQKLAGASTTAQAAAGTVDKVRTFPGRVQQFLHDVRLEMRNVTWPSKTDVQATTIVVMVATFFFGFYLGVALDIPISWLVTWLLRVGRGLVG